MLFLLHSLGLSGDSNKINVIDEELNGTEKGSWKKSSNAEVNHFLRRKSWLIQSKAKILQAGRNPIEVKRLF